MIRLLFCLYFIQFIIFSFLSIFYDYLSYHDVMLRFLSLKEVLVFALFPMNIFRFVIQFYTLTKL